MSLLIDQGNSYTKFARVNDGNLQPTRQCATNKTATVDALYQEISAASATSHVTRLALCTVAPELLPNWQAAAEQAGLPLQIITGNTPTILENAYRSPDTLGADRLMAAVAASSLVGNPVISLSLGTATVVDAVSAEGVYLGGMIAPGIDTCSRALANSASALWPVAWQPPSSAIGRDSQSSLANGIFFHHLGGIRAMIAALREELGQQTPMVMTGGWAGAVSPFLDLVRLIDPQLVLRGIGLTLGLLGDGRNVPHGKG